MDKNKDYLTTSQAAKLLSVSPDTVLKWVKAGKVKSYRTLGGHFRIPISELDIPLAKAAGAEPSMSTGAAEPSTHQYCWEFLGGGEIKPECLECITYRSRAKRCYQLKDLPNGMGCLNLMCDADCSECEYFKLVNGQATNILVLSTSAKLITDMESVDKLVGYQFKFAESEYAAAVMIQDFRPDYIIVDCALGKKRTGTICRSLYNDIRLPVARIILSSKSLAIDDYCDREVFGWIQKPFSIEQLKDLVAGVPGSSHENNSISA